MATRKGRRAYVPHLAEKKRTAVANTAYAALRAAAGMYVQAVTGDEHIRQINAIASSITTAHTDSLNEGRLPFGVAQKLFNSYLKYLWCARRIEMPPDCPFDARIIAKLKLPDGCERQWTKGSEADYRVWVDAAKLVAKSEPLSEWELRVWAQS
jgi:hypothetical protein